MKTKILKVHHQWVIKKNYSIDYPNGRFLATCNFCGEIREIKCKEE